MANDQFFFHCFRVIQSLIDISEKGFVATLAHSIIEALSCGKLHGKNGFAERSKILAGYRPEK